MKVQVVLILFLFLMVSSAKADSETDTEAQQVAGVIDTPLPLVGGVETGDPADHKADKTDLEISAENEAWVRAFVAEAYAARAASEQERHARDGDLDVELRALLDMTPVPAPPVSEAPPLVMRSVGRPPMGSSKRDGSIYVPLSMPLAGVPYLNQNNQAQWKSLSVDGRVVDVGKVACGCTSVAMVWSFDHPEATPEQLNRMMRECFKATSRPGVGVVGPEIMVRYLKKIGYKTSAFFPYREGLTWREHFLIAWGLSQGLPQIVSVKFPSSRTSHFVTIIGLENSRDPEQAVVVVHDPNGRPAKCLRRGSDTESWCYPDPSGSGANYSVPLWELMKDGGRLYNLAR